MQVRHLVIGISAIALSTASMVSFAQATGTPASPIVIKTIWSMGEKSAMGFGALKFKEIVEKKSGGRIKVELFPNNSVSGGSSPAAVQLVKANTLQMTQQSMDQVSSLVPEFGVASLPFLFSTREQAYRVVDGPLGQDLLNRLESQGLVGVSFFELGFRQISNKRREILKPEDLKGLRIRVSEGGVKGATLRALGATPVTVPGPEIYMALQTGVVDGQETPDNVFASFKLWEVQNYITKWNYVWDATVVIFSKQFMDAQTPEIQQIIKDSAKEATALQREEVTREETVAEKDFAEKKVKITTLTPAQLKPFRDASQVVYTTTAPKTMSPEFIDKWLKAVAQ